MHLTNRQLSGLRRFAGRPPVQPMFRSISVNVALPGDLREMSVENGGLSRTRPRNQWVPVNSQGTWERYGPESDSSVVLEWSDGSPINIEPEMSGSETEVEGEGEAERPASPSPPPVVPGESDEGEESEPELAYRPFTMVFPPLHIIRPTRGNPLSIPDTTIDLTLSPPMEVVPELEKVLEMYMDFHLWDADMYMSEYEEDKGQVYRVLCKPFMGRNTISGQVERYAFGYRVGSGGYPQAIRWNTFMAEYGASRVSYSAYRLFENEYDHLPNVWKYFQVCDYFNQYRRRI